MKAGYTQRIRERAQELQAVIAAAQAELTELQVAERVLRRLSSDADESQHHVSSGGLRTKDATIADMIVQSLSEAGPMTKADLLLHLRANWREDLGETTLVSTLSRTKNAGRITLNNGVWTVAGYESPNENAGAAASAETEAEAADDRPGFNSHPSPAGA